MNQPTHPASAAPTRLPPVATLDIKFFWDACDREELVAERCGECHKFRFPPRPMCPHCHSLKREHVKLSGRGKVYSWIRPQHPMPVGFAQPPVVALIELDEGFRLVSNLEGVAFEDVRPGMAVEVGFAPTMKNRKVPVFRPVQGA
ncbi:MAG: OB-fold domain-containing protein [Gammaproteobacteria bacterium]|nr:OB-fold domain-containing protein [Gammaproteobacteria bacterium]